MRFYRLPMPAKNPLYDRDFFAWSRQQAELLRAGKLAQTDIEHIAEEIDSMGRAEKRELISNPFHQSGLDGRFKTAHRQQLRYLVRDVSLRA
jgi:Domain of unknown function DUF29